jgi:hypothetical protein
MLIDHQGYDSSTKEKKHRIGILTGNIKKGTVVRNIHLFLFQASTKTTPDPHVHTVIWNQVPPLFDYKQQKVKHTH